MKKKLVVFFTVTILVFISLPLFNYYIDIARVFSKDFEHTYENKEANYRFLQIEYVKEHQDIYHSFIIGSSRVGMSMDLKSFPGWYPLWYGDGNLEEHKRTIKALIASDIPVKQIILAIDHLDIYRKSKENDYFRRPYPIGMMETVKFYNFYLFRTPGEDELEILSGNKKLKKKNGYFYSSGRNGHNSETGLRNLEMFASVVNNKNRKPNTVNYALNQLREIVDIAKKEGIDLRLYIAPLHYKSMLMHHPKVISTFKKKLAKISPFWDFSTLAHESMDYRNWRESNHFTKRLGAQIREIVINHTKPWKNLESGRFGNYITAENVNKHIENQFSTIIDKIPDVIKYDSKVVLNPFYVSKRLFYAKDLSFMLPSAPDNSFSVEINNIDTNPYEKYVIYVDLFVKKDNELSIGYESQGKEAIIQNIPLKLNTKGPVVKRVDGKQTVSLVVPASELNNIYTFRFVSADVLLEKITVRGLKPRLSL